MQKIFYLIFALLFLSSFLHADVISEKENSFAQKLEQSLPREVEEGMERDLGKQKQAYGIAWVCNSRYAGPVGYGYYYGWAYNQTAAFANALATCRLNHRYAPQFCIVTNCYYRFW